MFTSLSIRQRQNMAIIYNDAESDEFMTSNNNTAENDEVMTNSKLEGVLENIDLLLDINIVIITEYNCVLVRENHVL